MGRLDATSDVAPGPALTPVPAAEWVLSHVAADPTAPLTTAVVGPGGSGKSAVLDAVAALYERADVPVARVDAVTRPEALSPDRAVLVDDAHQLDADALDGLRQLARTGAARLVVAYRPWPRPSSLSGLAAILTRRRAPVVVGHLDRDGVAAWVAARIGYPPPDALTELVYEEAGGLPLLVDVLCQALVDNGTFDPRRPEHFTRPDRLALPGDLAERIRCQLDELERPVLNLLLALSVGASLDTETLGPLLDTDADTLTDTVEAARATGFLADDGATVPLIRRLMLRLTSVMRVRDMQQRLAGVQLDRGGSVLAAGRQLLATGARGAQVASVLEAAGDEALRQSPSLASQLYDGAVEAGAPAPGLSARRAEAAALAGDLDHALRLTDQVVADPAAPDRDRGVCVAAAVLAHRGLLARSAELYRCLPSANAATLLAVPPLVGTGALAEARAVLAEADANIDKSPTLLAGAAGLMARGVLDTITGSPTAALSQLARATVLLEPAGQTILLPDTPAVLTALVALHCGELSIAESTLERASNATLGGRPARARHLLLQAWVAMVRGRLIAARTLLGRADQPGEQAEPRDELIASVLYVALARRGGDLPALTSAWVRARDAIVRYPIDLYALRPLGELAVAAARLGEQQWVAPHLKEAKRLLDDLGNPPLWEAPMHWFELHAAVIADQPAEAKRHAAALAEAAPTSTYAAALAAAAHSWLKVMAGDIDPEDVQAAARRLHDVGLPWDGARLAGNAAMRTTDRKAMSVLLSCARTLKDPVAPPEEPGQPGGDGSIATDPPARKAGSASTTAAARGGRIGAQPAGGATAAGPGGSARSGHVPSGGGAIISGREREVGRLVLAGLTHKQIGERLFISAKTVEHHVAAIRRRLSAGSRDELFARLRSLIESSPDDD